MNVLFKIKNIANKLYDNLGFYKPIRQNITIATGVSVNAIFTLSDQMKQLIKKYGSFGEINVTNGHWTTIYMSSTHILVKMTGGGNTGNEMYKPSYFINLLANTKRIFGDEFVGVLSAYGCCRAINFKNSTQYTKFANNGMITYGKGGTGMTKRHIESALILCHLGFQNEICEYFNSIAEGLGNRIIESYKIHYNSFFEDTRERTKFRMGYI